MPTPSQADIFLFQFNNRDPVPVKHLSGFLTTSELDQRPAPDNQVRTVIQSLEFGGVEITLPFPANATFEILDGILKGEIVSLFATIMRVRNNQLDMRFNLGNSRVVRFTLPGLDSDSGEVGFATLVLKPEHINVELVNNGERVVIQTANVEPFIRSNFKISIGNLPTKRVSHVSPFTVSIKIQDSLPDGVPVRHPITIELHSLSLDIPESDLRAWLPVFNDFLQLNQQEGINGSISYLSANLKNVLVEITMSRIQIVSTFFPGTTEDIVRRFTVGIIFDHASVKSVPVKGDSTSIHVGGSNQQPVISKGGLDTINQPINFI